MPDASDTATAAEMRRTFGDRIRGRLAELGQPQAWLCEQTGANSATISRIITGQLPGSDALRAKIERALGVRIFDYGGGQGVS